MNFVALLSRLAVVFKSSLLLQLLSSSIFLLLSLFFIKKRETKKHLPPGPWRLPFLGSVSVFTQYISNTARTNLRVTLPRKYGRILALKIGPMEVIWLSDIESIKEAFITKGDLISDRLGGDESERSDVDKMIGTGNGIGGTNFGKEFKERKQLTFHAMKDFGFGGKSLDETVCEETEFLVEEFGKFADGKTPTDVHFKFIHLAVSNVICSVVFGKRFDYRDEAFVCAVQAIRWLFSSPFIQIVSRIPILRSLPSIKKMAQYSKEQIDVVLNFIETQIKSHKEDFDFNQPRDFIDLCLQKSAFEEEGTNQKSSIGTENIKKIIGDLFFAGTDTTAASLMWVIIYMIHFPDVQAKCQKEIKDVLGIDGDLRQLSVQRQLPYTTATLLETQRISTIAPASLPHKVRKDTTISGYHIPKGALVFANIRFLHYDETKWDAPVEFNPDRWIDPNDSNKILQNSNFIPFSLGKRRCLGENLAKTEYFTFAVRLLSKFRFKMVDPENPPSLNPTGLIVTPAKFKIVMETIE